MAFVVAMSTLSYCATGDLVKQGNLTTAGGGTYRLTYNDDKNTTYKLTVSGGEINANYYDWEKLFDITKVTEVEVEEGVTYLCDSVFAYFTNLEKIKLASTIELTDGHTVEGCTKLESVVLPKSLTRLDDYTFYGCTNLKEVVMSDSITCIEEEAFEGCTNLKRIVIPESVTEIERYAFGGSSFDEIIIYGEDRNLDYSDVCCDPSQVTYIGVTSGASVDEITAPLAASNTFNVRVNTSEFGGDGTDSKYLSGVSVVINDVEKPLTYCYADGDDIVFPVQLTLSDAKLEDLSTVSIRAEVAVKADDTEDEITYLVSSAKWLTK
jgi:hypothetical protein